MSAATLLSAACRATVPRAGRAGRLLVVSTTMMALGLGGLIASLTLFVSDRGGIAQPQPPLVIDRGDVPRLGSSWDGPVQGLTVLRPLVGATGTETPLPHAGVTARNIGQLDSPRDPRAFLIDAATQIHAPASAPVPRRSAAPHSHGVD